MKSRIMQDEDGNNRIEASNDGKGWYWVATFKDIDHAKKFCPEAETPSQCEECLEEIPHGREGLCYKCCEHAEHDHGICDDCGEDISDDLAGKAESSFEGER